MLIKEIMLIALTIVRAILKYSDFLIYAFLRLRLFILALYRLIDI